MFKLDSAVVGILKNITTFASEFISQSRKGNQEAQA